MKVCWNEVDLPVRVINTTSRCTTSAHLLPLPGTSVLIVWIQSMLTTRAVIKLWSSWLDKESNGLEESIPFFFCCKSSYAFFAVSSTNY